MSSMADLFVVKVSQTADLYTLSVWSQAFKARLHMQPKTIRRLLGAFFFLITFWGG
jgi:hypothetical protein